VYVDGGDIVEILRVADMVRGAIGKELKSRCTLTIS
jgi:hypothetical protein